MPRYRLLSAHFTEEDKYLLGDNELDADPQAPITGYDLDEDGNQVIGPEGAPIPHRGTLVGDGTPHKWTRPPTPEMVGLDEESRKLVEAEIRRGDGLDPVTKLPVVGGGTISLAELKAAAAQFGYTLEEA
jgi:hypothetical protein